MTDEMSITDAPVTAKERAAWGRWAKAWNGGEPGKVPLGSPFPVVLARLITQVDRLRDRLRQRSVDHHLQHHKHHARVHQNTWHECPDRPCVEDRAALAELEEDA